MLDVAIKMQVLKSASLDFSLLNAYAYWFLSTPIAFEHRHHTLELLNYGSCVFRCQVHFRINSLLHCSRHDHVANYKDSSNLNFGYHCFVRQPEICINKIVTWTMRSGSFVQFTNIISPYSFKVKNSKIKIPQKNVFLSRSTFNYSRVDYLMPFFISLANSSWTSSVIKETK